MKVPGKFAGLFAPLPGASRLALGAALLMPPPILTAAYLGAAWRPEASAVFSFWCFCAVAAALFAYGAAGYLRLVRWVREGFEADGNQHAVGHLWTASKVLLGIAAFALVAVYFRYEIVAAHSVSRTQYYLVWDRWTGEVSAKRERYDTQPELIHTGGTE